LSGRVVAWFSAGAASAVAAKLALCRYTDAEVVIARCVIPSEHEDNDRFAADCERWFGQPIRNLRSTEFADTWDVWEKRRYIAGVAGAPCTTELKKAVRHQFEMDWQPDVQVFGYTAEERLRVNRFRQNNPEVRLVAPLIDAGLSKADCLAMVDRAGIEIPAIYRLGFRNANCIPCPKATAPAYWNRIRRHFPQRFDRMVDLSRLLNVRLVELNGERIFLDELPPAAGAGDQEPDMDCSLMCAIAESKMLEGAAS
jgi:hypothetical protein